MGESDGLGGNKENGKEESLPTPNSQRREMQLKERKGEKGSNYEEERRLTMEAS